MGTSLIASIGHGPHRLSAHCPGMSVRQKQLERPGEGMWRELGRVIKSHSDIHEWHI